MPGTLAVCLDTVLMRISGTGYLLDTWAWSSHWTDCL